MDYFKLENNKDDLPTEKEFEDKITAYIPECLKVLSQAGTNIFDEKEKELSKDELVIFKMAMTVALGTLYKYAIGQLSSETVAAMEAITEIGAEEIVNMLAKPLN
jgi:hypothetical protein